MHDFVIFACFMCPAFCASRHDTCNGGRLLPTVFPRLIASAAKTPSLRLTHSQVYKESRCDQCLSIAVCTCSMHVFMICMHVYHRYHCVFQDSCTIFLGRRRICFELVPPVRPEMIAVRRLPGDEVRNKIPPKDL